MLRFSHASAAGGGAEAAGGAPRRPSMMPELKTPMYANFWRFGIAMFSVWLPPIERPAIARLWRSASTR